MSIFSALDKIVKSTGWKRTLKRQHGTAKKVSTCSVKLRVALLFSDVFAIFESADFYPGGVKSRAAWFKIISENTRKSVV
jgi:hypothetical protein